MIDFGTVKPGTILYIPFATYDSNDPSASATLTGLAVTDIEIYKDGGTTQRGSDSGYALLDTDGIDFDGVTGIHGFSIDLADNTTAGFYAAGSQYWVVVASVTVDSGTVNFIAATFRIGYSDAVLNTTIATLASQTSFTLTSGPADDNGILPGCVILIHDVASAVQIAIGVVSAYTGSTKTVTLLADPGVFTMAAGDNVSIWLPSNAKWFATTTQTGRDIGASVLLSSGTGAGQISLTSGEVTPAAASKTGYALSSTGLNLIVKLKALLDCTPAGSVVDDNDPDPTATAFETDLAQSPTEQDDHYKGAFLVFYSGALSGQSRKISGSVVATNVITVATAFTEIPAAGDDFVIIGRSE